MQKGFVFDVNKCTGCEACQVACQIENGVTPGINWRRVYTFNDIHYPGLPHFSHSLACNHCEDPPCMTHCPAAAYTKDAATGAVILDADACIGCGYCSWVCPFDAPRLNHSTGKMEKCTFCIHRLEEGLEPACAALCPTGALKFGDHHAETGGGKIVGFTASSARPAVSFVPLRRGQEQPVCTAAPDDMLAADDLEPVSFREDPRITLRSEWPLVGFTILFAALAAWTAASALAGAAMGRAAFIVTGAAVMILGALHLGDRTRAYRSILKWRTSWLSREVIFVFTFLAAAAVYALFAPGNGVLGWLAALAGFVALFAVDRVYDAAGTGGLRAHSARVFLTGFYFLGILSGNSIIFGVFLAARSFLYWRRKSRTARSGGEARPMLSLARIVLGFLIPIALWSGEPGVPPLTVIVGVLAGEFIDRCEFYLELDFPSPPKQMAQDLAAELRSRKNLNEVS
jgi:DMSO reductase iron-sulfur subunit